MKNILLLLPIIIFTLPTFSKNTCEYEDGFFYYNASLNVANIEDTFNKDDFIDFISTLDDISNEDLDILTSSLANVSKNAPFVESANIKIKALNDISSILENLNNSVVSYSCTITDCTSNEGKYSYYILLNMDSVETDFNKDNFINFVISMDDISEEDLAILNNNVLAVYNAFTGTQTELLRRVAILESDAILFSIFEKLPNSLLLHECISLCGEDCLLGGGTLGINNLDNPKKISVFPNPVTQESVIKLDKIYSEVEIDIINNLGQIIDSKSFSNTTSIELKNFKLNSGVFFIRVHNSSNQNLSVLKMVKR
jgi:hypothetical protein